MKTKTVLLLIAVLIIASCKKDEPVNNPLIGTKWSTFQYTSIISNKDVYSIMFFRTSDTVEYYFATEKTNIIGSINKLHYSYSSPTISILLNGQDMDGNTHEATYYDSFIRFLEHDYTKE